MDGQGEPERGAASRPAGFNGWNRRSHSAGHLCSKKRFSHALWSCCCRHAVRMARDSQYPPAFSPCRHERAAIEFAHASMGTPAFYDHWHSVACSDLDHNLFRRWTAMVGPGIFSFSRRHFSLLSARTRHTCLISVCHHYLTPNALLWCAEISWDGPRVHSRRLIWALRINSFEGSAGSNSFLAVSLPAVGRLDESRSPS